MNATAPGAWTYLTASYRADLPQVLALRRSLRACGDTAPHHIVVHTEDMALFARALAEDPQVVLAGTAQYLPPFHEDCRRRVVAGRRPHRLLRSAMKRLGMHRRIDALAMTGWHYQQLTKLHAAASLATECVVVLDSDLIALRRPDPARFFVDGRCALLETRDGDTAGFYDAWLRHTAAFLGIAPASVAAPIMCSAPLSGRAPWCAR